MSKNEKSRAIRGHLGDIPVLAAERELDKDPNDHPVGKGLHPAFPALWHLKALGVVKDLDHFNSDVWPGKPCLVAVIDTPVAWNHPNLTEAVDKALMRDFSVHNEGVFVIPNDQLTEVERNARAILAGKASKQPDKPAMAMIALESDPSCHDKRPFCRPLFVGAHGTAVAGLIGGRPATTKLQHPATVKDDRPNNAWEQPLELPYAGINPDCRIVPISTTASPDPEMVLGALEYAELVGAEVIAIAAAWDDRDIYLADTARWAAVDKQLEKMAKKSVILCAAGNSGRTGLAYPALLAVDHDVPAQKKVKAIGVFAVTACDSKGTGLNYAPEQDTSGKVIATLSAPATSYDSRGILVDPYQKVDPWLVPSKKDPILGANIENLPDPDLISLDPPGPYGYNPSIYSFSPPAASGPQFEIASLFNRFSGTSAATAIAAGLISLYVDGRHKVPPKGTKAPTGLFDAAQAKKLIAGGI